MRIAIIGVGNVGSALARAFRTAGHTVVVSFRHASHAQKIAEELDVSAASSNRAAAGNAEMAVLAVHAKAVASVLDETAESLNDTIVVDPTDPQTRTPRPSCGPPRHWRRRWSARRPVPAWSRPSTRFSSAASTIR